MRSIIIFCSLVLSTFARATVCDQGNQFFRSMHYEQREIVTRFMNEKLGVAENDVLKTNFKAGKAHARLRDVLVIGPFKVVDTIVRIDECGVIDLDSNAGKGIFEVEYLNREGERCQTILSVKGGVTLLTNQYRLKISHSPKNVTCE